MARLLPVVLLATLPLLARAGTCREQLRPLLLATEPAAAELARVRALCDAEAATGDAEASYQLALLSLGLGGNWQPDAAIPLIRDAADRGVTEAQYWLAWQSESGPLLPHDPAVALGWYEKAAAGRHRLALQRLAEASERGELGLAIDERKALAYRAQIRRCDEENARQVP
jgi:TPR repeat protein